MNNININKTYELDGKEWVTTTTVAITETTREEFDWLKLLKAAAAGTISIPYGSTLHGQLRKLAGDWPTCACGQLCKQLPRDGQGRPMDYDTAKSGVEFMHDVAAANWSRAYARFQTIERRTQQLLQ